MNINEAKQEIIHTIKAYLRKDETGAYEIPVEKQRPMLLMGPPGIGKTAIMEQIATELGINLVSYTITHHTRQSAIGLPFISHRRYGGEEYSVTEYTMSEIIASVYEQIERSGIHEGILFLDEINCVSETLAPMMLQFLQYKTFGPHRVPDGFVIVTAGNPPEYNKSVRDFDIVTLDRVKRIDITAEYDAWKRYAYPMGVHGAILAYLDIKKENFYIVKADLQGQQFVTARGWEDLSRIMKVYEEMGLPITRELVQQYLEDPEVARDFATYYALYQKYRTSYHIPEILRGERPKDMAALAGAPFDEKLSLIGLLTDALGQGFRAYGEEMDIQRAVFTELKKLRDAFAAPSGNASESATATDPGAVLPANQGAQPTRDADAVPDGTKNGLLVQLSSDHDALVVELQRQQKAHLLSHRAERIQRKVLLVLEELMETLRLAQSDGTSTDEALYALAKAWFTKREQVRKSAIESTSAELTNAFDFLHTAFSDGQELVIFLSNLNASSDCLRFIRECGNDSYYRYNQFLLLRDQRSALRAEAKRLLEL
ncbi:MAG TPA: ATPase [Oribacterium sp.]|nr:ATPase [Oribacterium sp.]